MQLYVPIPSSAVMFKNCKVFLVELSEMCLYITLGCGLFDVPINDYHAFTKLDYQIVKFD